MQRLKELYPDYAQQVDFYAISTFNKGTESLESLEKYRERQGHPWPVATTTRQALADLNVTIQSTKIAVDSRGVITYRDGFGQGDPQTWQRVFEDLAQGQ